MIIEEDLLLDRTDSSCTDRLIFWSGDSPLAQKSAIDLAPYTVTHRSLQPHKRKTDHTNTKSPSSQLKSKGQHQHQTCHHPSNCPSKSFLDCSNIFWSLIARKEIPKPRKRCITRTSHNRDKKLNPKEDDRWIQVQQIFGRLNNKECNHSNQKHNPCCCSHGSLIKYPIGCWFSLKLEIWDMFTNIVLYNFFP